MAKTAKIKKRQVTIHSRAARRAASPSIDIDKSLKPTPSTPSAPPPVAAKPHVLAASSGGIRKSKQKSKPLKRAQRERQLKGMARAEDNMEKLALKVQKSIGKDKKVRERRKGWEDVNDERISRKKSKNAFDALGDDEVDEPTARRVWVDEEMEEVQEDADALVPEVSGEVKQLDVVVPESIPLPVENEDEIL